MRKAPQALIAASLLLALAACDAEQPAVQGTSTARISFASLPAELPIYDCWEVWTDVGQVDPNDPNQIVYDGIVDQPVNPPSRCQPTGASEIGRYASPHATTVSILRNGATALEIVATSASGGGQYLDITPFNTTPAQDVPDLPPTGVGTADNRYFINGKRSNAGTFTFLAFVNAKTEDTPEGRVIVTTVPVPNLFDPRPSQTDPDQPVSATTTLDVSLDFGDTIYVSARKAPLSGAVNPLYPPPVLEGSLTVDGVLAAVRGETKTSSDDETALAFSFTRR